jgi:predicted DNA-binding transcriptional regulator AlpA
MTIRHSTPKGPWVSINEAAEMLGMSRSTIYRLRDDGHLFPKVHYISITPGKTSRRLWCPDAIQESMAKWTPPAGNQNSAK